MEPPFRRLEQAFMGLPSAEEAQLRNRLDKLNAQFGGKPYGAKIFEAGEQDKARIDAYLAASDLLEAMALTPWGVSLNKAGSAAASNSIRSVTAIARPFERFSGARLTKAGPIKKLPTIFSRLPDNSPRTPNPHNSSTRFLSS